VSDVVRRKSMPRVRRGTLGLFIGSLLALLLGGIALVRADEPSISRATMPEGLSCIGEESSLSEAAAKMPFPILLADTELANHATVTRVLLCSTDSVEIDYGSGVRVTLGVNHLSDPVAVWERMAKLYPEFSVGTVRSLPASLANPDMGAIGGVDFVENGVRIIVTGNSKIPLDDLVAVAESLKVADTPSPSPNP
jgi:hypothetical protein